MTSNENKFKALEELIRREHTVEEGLHSDLGGQDIVHYCGGCGADLDEQECPYLAILDGPVEPEVDNRPHSRACGWRKHDHGTDCHTNCPTCGGKND